MNFPAVFLASALALSTLALAENKDPGQHQFKDLQKRGSEFIKEAEMWEGLAGETTGKIASDLKKFAAMTREEGENLLKAAKAMENRQIRVAQRYEQKAAEICAKRGKLMDEVHTHAKNIKTSMHKSKPEQGKPLGKAPEKKTESTDVTHNPSAEKQVSPDAFEKLKDEISRLGEE